MIQSIKILIIVTPLILAGFIAARGAFASVVDPNRMIRWAMAMIAMTVAAFMIHDYWAALFVITFIAIALGASEPLKPIIFLIVAFAIAPGDKPIPGIGGINNLFLLSSMLSVCILLLTPYLFSAKKGSRVAKVAGGADFAVIAFCVLTAVLSFRDTTFTHGLRIIVSSVLLTVSVYWAFSRSVRSVSDLQAAATAYVAILVALSLVALAEFALQWHFYTEMARNWGIDTPFAYTGRGGFQRSFASTIAPIGFGICLNVAIVLAIALMRGASNRSMAWLVVLGLVAALIATLSRTPWLATCVSVVIFFATGSKAAARLMQLGMVSVFGLVILLATPIGGTLLGLIPGLDAGASSTFGYRMRLLEVSVDVISQSWLFGYADPSAHPDMQVLVQGQGIVDLVNTYVDIALSYGLVGASLFVMANVAALRAAWTAMRQAAALDLPVADLCRGFFAAHLAFLIGIAGTSWRTGVTEELAWVMLALTVAAARVTQRARQEASTAATQSEPAIAPTQAAAPTVHAPSPSPSLPDRAAVPAHLRQYVPQPPREADG
ncbi:MAG: O-antigen ligase family protein [Pseudomonadota bacterium]